MAGATVAAILRSDGRQTKHRTVGVAAGNRTRGRAPRARRPVRGAIPETCADPRRARSDGTQSAGRRRAAPLVFTSGRRPVLRVRRPDDDHDRHRLGQVAVLSAADARGPDRRPPRACPVPVPDQVAGPGPGPGDPRLRTPQARPPGDLRRRHPARRAGRDPQAQQPGPHQPRHAPRRDPPQPPRLGRAALKPRVRRRRRGARLPRGVRLSRRQRAATPPAPGARSTARRRGSSWPARRSPTRSSWPSA